MHLVQLLAIMSAIFFRRLNTGSAFFARSSTIIYRLTATHFDLRSRKSRALEEASAAPTVSMTDAQVDDREAVLTIDTTRCMFTRVFSRG